MSLYVWDIRRRNVCHFVPPYQENRIRLQALTFDFTTNLPGTLDPTKYPWPYHVPLTLPGINFWATTVYFLGTCDRDSKRYMLEIYHTHFVFHPSYFYFWRIMYYKRASVLFIKSFSLSGIQLTLMTLEIIVTAKITARKYNPRTLW